MPIEELFETFDMVPLASGTIGQVHRATLSAKGAAHVAELAAAEGHTRERQAEGATAVERADEQRHAGRATAAASAPQRPQQTTLAGMAVAVKVRHPGVHEAIKYDFTVLRGLVRALNTLPSLAWLHLDEMTWQFESLLAAQVRDAPQPRCRSTRSCVWLWRWVSSTPMIVDEAPYMHAPPDSNRSARVCDVGGLHTGGGAAGAVQQQLPQVGLRGVPAAHPGAPSCAH